MVNTSACVDASVVADKAEDAGKEQKGVMCVLSNCVRRDDAVLVTERAFEEIAVFKNAVGPEVKEKARVGLVAVRRNPLSVRSKTKCASVGSICRHRSDTSSS